MLCCADWGRTAATQSIGIDQCSVKDYGGNNDIQGETFPPNIEVICLLKTRGTQVLDGPHSQQDDLGAGRLQQAETAQLADQVCGLLGGCQAVIGTGDNFYQCVRTLQTPFYANPALSRVFM